MFDWDDLKYFLAVVRGGSTLAASRTLGVNQTTVARRVDALERSLGLQLFERRTDGYAATDAGSELARLAVNVEREALAIEEEVRSRTRAVAGTLRVTTTELLAIGVLAPVVSELRAQHSALQIELIADDRRLDLTRGEADVAIRLGTVPDAPGIVRKRVGRSVWALYCAHSYADRHGVPQKIEDLDRHEILTGAGQLVLLASLVQLRKAAPKAAIAMRCNSVPNLIAAVRSGAGVGPLPGWAATEGPALVECPVRELRSSTDIWLLFRESQRGAPHLKAFVQAVTQKFAALRPRLEGKRV